MAIDIRADVNCSLGVLISASVSDSYVQENGLVFVTGNALINGIITPEPGTIVTFSYTKSDVVYTLPRKLRVLSSFADPFRRTTSVELGCKLTYLKNVKPAPTVDGEPEAETGKRQQCLNGYIEYDANSPYGIPISAAGLMDTCLLRLGISASSNPLSNRFYRESFEFTPGYVTILGDLLLSESYFGYLDINEVLQVVSLDQYGGSGPVIDSSNIIDISGIGVGELPADAVVIRYDSLTLKEDLEEEDETIIDQRDWMEDETIGPLETITIRWTSGSSVQQFTVNHRPVTLVVSEYGEDDSWDENTCVIVDTNGEGSDLSNTVIKRTTTKTVSRSIQAADYVGKGLERGINMSLSLTGFETKIETYEFNNFGDVIREEIEEYEPYFAWAGRINIELFYDDGYVSLGSSPVLVKRTIKETEILYADLPTYISLKPGETYSKLRNGSKTVTYEYLNWVLTQQGNNAVSGQNVSAAFLNVNEAYSYLNTLENNIILDSTVVNISRDRVTVGIQRRPPIEERIGSSGANSSGEYKGELLFETGSPLSNRIIEFSMPYQSDDYYSPSGSIIKGDAKEKASRYGRAQNRLLKGSRNGMNIQLEPELLPEAPFSPVIVQANGLSALYRTNGNNWTMDSNGILASTDALFWGAVGGTGVFWFPVAPGIVTLPSTPPVVDGQMTVSTLIPSYNEISIQDARVSLRVVVTKFEYSLSLLTVIPDQKVDIAPVCGRYQLAKPPSVNIAMAAPTMVVAGSNGLRIPTAPNVSIDASTPTVGSFIVRVPAIDTAIDSPVPVVGGQIGSAVQPPVVSIEVVAELPSLA